MLLEVICVFVNRRHILALALEALPKRVPYSARLFTQNAITNLQRTLINSQTIRMSIKTLITHSGTFHADEALALWMLTRLPEFRASPIVRTRDPIVIASGSVCVDVGGSLFFENVFCG